MAGFRVLCKKSFILDSLLVGVLFYLIYVFLEQSSRELPERSISSIKFSEQRRHEIARRPPDHRSRECLETKYGQVRKVSLISYFYNFQLYDLKVALASAIHENDDYIGEVIVVDDGSNEKDIVDDSTEYFDVHYAKFKLLRNDVQRGSAKSIRFALDEARYDEVVILEPSVVCSVGWLLPLLNEISNDPNVIAVPHFDRVSESIAQKYDPVEDNYVAHVLWNLNTVLKKSITADRTSPGLRPDLFAARKSLLAQIGSIDEGLNYGGGDALELGMRVWCCGGSIRVVDCSRVGIANFHNAVKITSGTNLRRIVGLWFLNNSDIFLPISKNFKPTTSEVASIDKRKKLLFSSMKCKGAGWYFKEILKKNITLHKNVTKFGYLRAMSTSCASKAPDYKINVSPCDMNAQSDDRIFQLTSEKRILVGGKCMAAMPNAYVTTEDCKSDKENQKWRFTENSELLNIATGLCATHVTDPDKSTYLRQIVMVQSCNVDEQDHEYFKKWTFVLV